MDLLGGYASDDDDAGAPAPSTGPAAPSGASSTAATSLGVDAAPTSSGMVWPVLTPATGLNLSALLPSASQSLASWHDLSSPSTGAATTRKRKKTPDEIRAKEERRARKEQPKRQKTETEKEEEATAASSEPEVDQSSSLTQAAPDLRAVQSAGAMGLRAMLPPPKFVPAAPVHTASAAAAPAAQPVEQPDVEMHAAPAAPPPTTAAAAPAPAVEAAPAAPSTTAAPPTIRPPPGMRLPPGIRAAVQPPSNAAAADASVAGVSTSAVPAVAVAPTVPAQNAHLAEDNEPYVPLYARAQMQQQPAPKGDKRHNPLSQLGNLHGQDKFFKRASAQDIQFLTVNQDELTALTIAEELQKQQDEMHPHPGSGKVKVAAQFWNSSTGQMEATADASDLARRKAQINTLASSAAAMEVEMARQRQAGYAKRDSARKKYGW